MKAMDRLDGSPSKNVARTLIMRWCTGILALGCLYAGLAGASTATAYYILDPDFSLEDAIVVSLEDGNTITAGGTQIDLDSGESGVIPVIDLAPGTRISGTGAFTLGNSVKGAGMQNPESFSGTLFSIPHHNNSHDYLLLSPDTDAQVMIKKDAETTNITLTAGQVYTHYMGSDNGEHQLGIITSDVPILVQHKGYDNDYSSHAYPVPPATLELWGFRSGKILAGASGAYTQVSLYASNGDSRDESIDSIKWKELGGGESDSEGRGDAIHILSDEPVSAVMLDDSDGLKTTAFFGTEHLATHYYLPVDSRYVAVLCVEENTTITLYEEGYNPEQRQCNSDGLVPARVYFGASSSDVRVKAGARIEASKPVFLVYEDASTNDEKNLLGFDLRGVEPTVTNSGDAWIEDILPPDVVNLGLVTFRKEWGKTVITGEAGAAEAFAHITVMTATGETVTVDVNADGSFEINLNTDTDENVSIILTDSHGNSSEIVNVTAVGTTAGSLDVSPQGAGTYTVPLILPPGV